MLEDIVIYVHIDVISSFQWIYFIAWINLLIDLFLIYGELDGWFFFFLL